MQLSRVPQRACKQLNVTRATTLRPFAPQKARGAAKRLMAGLDPAIRRQAG
jgi:hypothetical protein